MIIGIDASRAFVDGRTGTENYSYYLITSLIRLPEAKKHTFVLFTRPNAILPKELAVFSNVIVKNIKWEYLWTQVGLAWETWKEPMISVLWIPAHTLPIFRNPRIKTVVTIHGLEYQWLPEYKNFLQKWYLPLSTIYAARRANLLIAVSDFTAKQLEKELHTNPKKIKVIQEGVAIHTPGVKDSHTPGVLAKYGIQDKKYILFVGTIQPRKNLVALVQAFSHFADGSDANAADYKLVVAGGTGWMVDEVFISPSRYSIQEKVVFTGRVSDQDLQSLYLGAALYVQPSITEGFGLPVLEAMKHGIPVISSDGGALSEVVGEAGILVSLSDSFVKNLSAAIKQVVSDKKLQNNLISMGHKIVKELTWDKAAKSTLDVLVGEGYNTQIRY